MTAYRIAISALVVLALSACKTTGTREPIEVDNHMSRLLGEMTAATSSLGSAQTVEALDAIARDAQARADQAAAVDEKLVWTVVAMRAHNRASFVDGVSDVAFETQRNEVFAAADAAREFCLGGGIDPRLGHQCTLAIATRAINDGVRAGRIFSSSLIAANWDGAAASVSSFRTTAADAPGAYKTDSAVLNPDAQDATRFDGMLVRSACAFTAAYNNSALPGPTDDPERQAVKDAYVVAMMTVARNAEVAPDGTACAGDAESNACMWDYEAGLANRCAELSEGEGTS